MSLGESCNGITNTRDFWVTFEGWEGGYRTVDNLLKGGNLLGNGNLVTRQDTLRGATTVLLL